MSLFWTNDKSVAVGRGIAKMLPMVVCGSLGQRCVKLVARHLEACARVLLHLRRLASGWKAGNGGALTTTMGTPTIKTVISLTLDSLSFVNGMTVSSAQTVESKIAAPATGDEMVM